MAGVQRHRPVIIEISSDESSDDEQQIISRRPSRRHVNVQPKQEFDDAYNLDDFVEEPESTDDEEEHDDDEDEDDDDDDDVFEEAAEFQVRLDEHLLPVPPVVPFTEEDCLRTILEMFPDIARDHVRNLFRDHLAVNVDGATWCGQMVGRILEAAEYPKENDQKEQRKRKRSDSSSDEEIRKWERTEREEGAANSQSVITVLSNEYTEIPVAHIREVYAVEKTLFRTFLTLDEQQRNYDSMSDRPYRKLSHPRVPPRAVSKRAKSNVDSEIIKAELAAAKQKRDQLSSKRAEEEKLALLEAANEQEAQRDGSMTECGCCFSDVPLNRTIHCASAEHFFCYDCIKQNVSTEIGALKCRPKCMDQSGCKDGFPRSLLMQVLDSKTFEKLEQMQQEEDIRLADIGDVESCPFCPFKAVMLPVEVDREFRCGNRDCEKASCRLCKEPSHLPKTCEEIKKDKKIDARHILEEAMTDKLIRKCNKCAIKFVKESGCNKMTCPTCRHVQCYVCGKSVRGYDHFHNAGPCQLYDNTEQRHLDEVKSAEAEVRAKVLREHPELTAADLEVKVSETVKGVEARRVQQNQERLNQAHPMPFPMPHLGAGHYPPGVPAGAAAFNANAVPRPAAVPVAAGDVPPVHPYMLAGARPLHYHNPFQAQQPNLGAPANPYAFPFHQGPQFQPLAPLPGMAPLLNHNQAFPPIGIPADGLERRMGGAIDRLVAAGQDAQLHVLRMQQHLNEQRLRVQMQQDEIARLALEERRRRRY